jgi:hypothetical protein
MAMRNTRIAMAFLLAACFLVAAVVAGQQAGGTPEPGQSGQPAADPSAGQDPEQSLNEREASLAARTRQLVNDYAKATDEDARAKIKEELAAVVKEHFQLRQALREQELAELEEQVKRLRGLLDKRQEAQQSIIDTRLNQLLHPSEGLGWDEGQGEPPDVAAPADEQSISEMDFDIEGVVLDVWQNRFLEVSLGLEDGVRPGHALIVHRDGESLGSVTVHTVRADRAVARFRDRSAPIKKGDRVARLPGRRTLEMLEGVWRVLSTESQGQQLPQEDSDEKARAFRFGVGGNFFIDGGPPIQGRGSYALDEKKQRIIFSGPEEVFFGRYRFEGDRLLLAISKETTPAEMASKPGSDIQVYTLERIPEETREADREEAGGGFF